MLLDKWMIVSILMVNSIRIQGAIAKSVFENLKKNAFGNILLPVCSK